MSQFTAADLVGLPVYARQQVVLRSRPDNSGAIRRVVSPGQRVGVIKGWIDRQPEDGSLYLEFDDPAISQFATSYAAYDTALDRPRLKKALEERIEAERRSWLGPNGRALEDAQNAVKETAATAGGQVLTGALALGGLYIIGRLLISGK